MTQASSRLSDSFAARLSLALKALNMSRAQLAAAAGVDKSLVSRWVSGQVTPSSYNLARISSTLARAKPGFNMTLWDASRAEFELFFGLCTPVRPEELGNSLDGILASAPVALEKDRVRRDQPASHLSQFIPVALWVCAALAIVAAIAGVYFFRQMQPLTDKDTIVLSDFANTTGDPVFDDTLRQGLEVALQQSPFLALISDVRIRQTLRLMGQQPETRLTPKLAREICVRTGSTAILGGSIAKLGKHYVLGLRAENCRTGEVLDDEQSEASGKEGVLGALDGIARQFRRRMGEARASLAVHDVPLASATTSSLDALKAYSTGWKVSATNGESMPFFQRAIELDPQFASAYAALALMHSANGEIALADSLGEKAFRLRDRASDDERYFITALYFLRVTGDITKALPVLQLWEQAYPRQSQPHQFLGGIAWPDLGDYEDAIREETLAIHVEPESVTGYFLLAWDDIFADRLTDAAHVIDAASARGLSHPMFPVFRYDLAFLNGNKREMERAAAATPAGALIHDREAFAAAYSGHLGEATALLHNSGDLSRAAGFPERAALFEVPAAIWQALFGETQEARASAVKAFSAFNDQDIAYGAGVALALAGDSSRSEKIAKDLDAGHPEDTSVQFDYLPTLRGLIALDRGDPKKALDALQTAAPYDFAVPRTLQHGFFGALYPVFVRGMAYLGAREGAAAAVEFRKVLSHPGLVVSDPIGALAHLELGRAYVLSGNLSEAKKAYRDFLALWKDADPDLPVFRQAKAEYSRLL